MKVNKGTEDEFQVIGYRQNRLRAILFIVLCVLTCGLLWLLARWWPKKRIQFTHVACDVMQAETVVVRTIDEQIFVQDVKEVELKSLRSKACHALNVTDNDSTVDNSQANYVPCFEDQILLSEKLRYFEHLFLRYYIANVNNDIIEDLENKMATQVHELSGYDGKLTEEDIARLSKGGLWQETVQLRTAIYGDNHIEVPVRSFFVYALQEAANPFYVFQVFSFTLWFVEGYVYYPSVIIFISILSITLTAYQTMKQMKKLRTMVGHPSTVRCLEEEARGTIVKEKSSLDLVPGDILLIPLDKETEMPCDAILLEGACVVNESSLTGESFPVSKKPIDAIISKGSRYEVDKYKVHTLQYGTCVIQARLQSNSVGKNNSKKDDNASHQGYVRCLVVRTGFCTLKGRLIRTIIYPKAIKFQAYREAYRFLALLGLLGICGMIYSFVVLGKHGNASLGELFANSLDIITIIVPPGLPACLSAGVVFALRKLKKGGIFCIDSQRINVCGDINLFVFDKTGTLTEDHLDVKGVHAFEKGELLDIDNTSGNEDLLLVQGMATCHSIHQQGDHLSGNPVDTGMFEFTGWSLQQSQEHHQHQSVVSPSSNQIISIVKGFPFESSLQRMSVLITIKTTQMVSDQSKGVTVFTKGSPEMILSFCNVDAGDLSAIHRFLKEETDMGHRVLALASKLISNSENVQNLPRSSIESDLQFCGLVVFENAVKPASKESIRLLGDGGVCSIMATGDHLNTAVSVARLVGIVLPASNVYQLKVEDGALVYETMGEQKSSPKNSPMTSTDSSISNNDQTVLIKLEQNDLDFCCVLTGPVYKEIRRNFKEHLPSLLVSCKVYARMSPVDKTLLIEDLKQIGYQVGMCGDGANDCGALRAANAGIALSVAEASVAAPFTSSIFDISCVPHLVREGRAALVTSFSIFKYIAMYSFIQFFGVLILYYGESSYSDWGFFMADLILAFAFALAMTQSRTSLQLARKCPFGRLSEPQTIINIFIQLAVILVFQIVAFVVARSDAQYKSPKAMGDIDFGFYYMSYESYSVMSINFFQYIWAVFACYTSEPYLEPLYKNFWFVFTFVVNLALVITITLAPATFINSIFVFPPVISTRLSLLIIALGFGNLIVLLAIDWWTRKHHCFKRTDKNTKQEHKKAFKNVQSRLLEEKCWILNYTQESTFS